MPLAESYVPQANVNNHSNAQYASSHHIEFNTAGAKSGIELITPCCYLLPQWPTVISMGDFNVCVSCPFLFILKPFFSLYYCCALHLICIKCALLVEDTYFIIALFSVFSYSVEFGRDSIWSLNRLALRFSNMNAWSRLYGIM